MVAADAFDEPAAQPINRETPGHMERLLRGNVGVDLGGTYGCEFHLGRGGGPHHPVPVFINEPVAGVQNRAAPGHLQPAFARFFYRAGFSPRDRKSTWLNSSHVANPYG